MAKKSAVAKPGTLDEIALSLDPIPDKASNGHGYTLVYDALLAPYRDKVIRLLEIGVWEGASLALWSAYFTRGAIIGADIDLSRCKTPLPDRCRLWEMNQSSEISLVNMARNVGPWDLIIDDGSHDPRHQVLTFTCLWPYLNPGGLYIVEDLYPSYTAYKGVQPSMLAFIGGTLQDDLHSRGKLGVARYENCPPVERERLSGRELEVKAIHLYRYLAIVEKM